MHDFLFYDSLRPGGKRYESVLRGHTVFEQDVVLQDHQLYAGRSGAYLVPGPGEVGATIVRLDTSAYTTLLKRLDQMAGYGSYKGGDNENDRTLLKFDYELEPGESKPQFGQAWLYVTSEHLRDEVRKMPRVLSGDWQAWENVRDTAPSSGRSR
jgi:gamma-glutamylcyclotransferase (GGCT)/AIG2-like uncharacterized protein YtfP